jgi:stage II sporulation protein GA (sporulation sigma-E factor processing peptidase)
VVTLEEEVFIIYADILVLINFVLDFLSIFIAGKLTSKKFHTLRIIAASLFGAIYSLVYYILYTVAWYFLLPMHIAAASIICVIAYKVSSLKDFIKITAVFILSAALLGGLLNAIYGLSGTFSEGIYTEISAPSLIIIAVLSTLVALGYALLCKKKTVSKSMRADIYIAEEPIKVDLLVDSGNMVTEPFSALPVIILRSSVMPSPLDNPQPESSPIPLRVIPIKTSSGGGMLFGFIPKKVVLRPLLEKEITVEAAVAIDTKTKSFATYDGLLPYSLTK